MRPATAPPRGPRPILVVDDAAVRRLLFWALTDEGYAVLEAPDGAVALARVRAATPSVILLHMRTPVLDGWEFARRYRARPGPHAPIVCVTAAADAAAEAARGAQVGAVASVS